MEDVLINIGVVILIMATCNICLAFTRYKMLGTH